MGKVSADVDQLLRFGVEGEKSDEDLAPYATNGLHTATIGTTYLALNRLSS